MSKIVKVWGCLSTVSHTIRTLYSTDLLLFWMRMVSHHHSLLLLPTSSSDELLLPATYHNSLVFMTASLCFYYGGRSKEENRVVGWHRFGLFYQILIRKTYLIAFYFRFENLSSNLVSLVLTQFLSTTSLLIAFFDLQWRSEMKNRKIQFPHTDPWREIVCLLVVYRRIPVAIVKTPIRSAINI